MRITLLLLETMILITFLLLCFFFGDFSTFDGNSTSKNKMQIALFQSLKISLKGFFIKA